MDESMFSDGSDASDFEAPVKTKAKAAPKKPAAAKPKAAPKAAAAKKQTTLKTTKVAPKKRAADSDDLENSDEEPGSYNDASLLSNTPPSSKKQKKEPAPKKSSGKPLMEIDNESFANGITASPKPKKGTNSDKYQKLTQLEHILKRPDTYIGSVERTDQQMWVFNSSTEAMESREVSFVPGLYKIFDEILVNAADNKQRDKNMNEIKVWVDREKGEISVRNNGRGIPIEIHDKEKIYIPEMIFGHLLTGSNYDDDEQKITGGRNGYGAKLANIFSTEFTLETADSKHSKKYKQTWRNNMSVAEKAKITAHKGDDFTRVTFKPDFAKFGMEQMDDDFEALVKRRVYDMAGTCGGVKVFLNDTRIKVTKFKQYMEMYTKAIKAENGDDAAAPEKQVILTDNPNERWEVGFAVSDGSFQQVSFVNSIATTAGGTHVNYIADQVVNKLAEIVKKKNKGGVALKNAQIKNHMFLFVNCSIVNPAFTSQTKEQLTTKSSQFGSKCTVSEKFLKDIAKTEVIQNIMDFAQKKADQAMKKSDGNRRARMNNSKLTDANKAGTKDGYKCTLILTEGDSASLLALAGRAVVNPDLFGVFPLRGKLLNVRDASIDQITKNQEIQNIKKFMGLQHKKDYTDTHSLRYGHLMIMTDQDHDGSHIKGLLINFLQCQFPSLLKLPGFLLEFITPIVKVWKGDPKHPKVKRDFFTMPEYEAWRQEPGHQKGWEHKYYKGLGTSDTADAEIYFSDLDKHLKTFHTLQEHENQMIDLAFSKKKADDRKQWLGNFVPGTFLDMSGTEAITYDDFINKELILYSMADNQRSIPSVMDGFKPGQRKVLYTCFRRNLKKDVKVVELAGSVSGLTAYAYGDTSLQQTIVGLAQNFVGSNNINTLEPSGNFGSRLQGGSDAASARYIYTRLSPFARKIFHTADEPLLTYNTDDGKTIEPETYMPVLPMILVNGADGIGTGWSTSIPNYRPEDIIENLKRRMKGSKEDMMAMKPWFRGWNGEAEDIGGGRFKFSGIVSSDDDKCELQVTELPVRIWTQDFKDRLEEIIRAEKTPSFIKDYIEYNTPTKVHFIIKMTESDYKRAAATGFEEQLKLNRTMATTNLVAFDSQGRIHRYESVLDIMEEFYHIRLDFYGKRKSYLLNEMNRELERLTNQARFVQMIIDNKLVVSKKKKSVLVAELQKLGFARFPKLADARKEGEFEKVVEEGNEETEEDVEIGANDYDYLLGMAIWSLTQERVERLRKQIGDREEEIDTLTKKSPKDLWCEDLDDLLGEWQAQLDEDVKRAKKSASTKGGRRASAKLGIGAKSKKRKMDDSFDDDSEFESAPKKKAAPKPKATMQKPMDSWLAPKEKIPAGVYDTDGNPIARPPAEEQGLIKSTSKPGSAVEALKAMAASKPAAKPAVRDEESDVAMVDPEPAAKPALKPAPRARAAATKKKVADSDDESEDEFHDVEESVDEPEPAKKPAAAPKADTARKGRAVAQKAKSYAVSDDDEESDFGDNALGDITAMVKGTLPTEAAGKPLLKTSASRPTSTHGIKPIATRKIGSDDVDDTDWGQLAASSPKKPEKFSAIDGDDDSILLSTRKPIVKTMSAVNGKTNGAAAATKDKLKKASAVEVVKTLSPAAKAYEKKKAAAAAAKPATKTAAKPAAKPSKKVVDSDDEDLADEILSDDDDLDSPAPAKAPAARPSRRAAATKSKYVVDDDEDDEEASEAEEPSFEEDDSD
ncbi:hypothetical protein MBLNU457_4312t1 [Dothideomycetes sp. NU457]